MRKSLILLTVGDISERYITVYKVVHEDKGEKRQIIFKDARQLARYLNPTNSMKSPFKVYKSKVSGMQKQLTEHSEPLTVNTYYCWTNEPDHTVGWFCQHPDCLSVESCNTWSDWSRALQFSRETEEADTLNTFYSGIES